jgi:IS5 family transposase
MYENLELKLIEIFCCADDFCQQFKQEIEHKLIPMALQNKKSKVPCGLSMSEMMAIEMFYHLQGSKCFKYYYQYFVEVHLKSHFSGLPSYNRFVQLKPRLFLYLFCFLLACRMGTRSGTYYVDSGKPVVCHNLRIHSHKVFKGLAKRGKTSTGWFFGLKLHLTVNQYGEIISFIITPGNVADNNLELGLKLCKGLCGKLFGDKGYISKKLREALAGQNLFLVTKIKKNMKNQLMALEDKMWLQSRGVIESVIDILKHICNIEHSRHRSPVNAIVNILAGMSAYSFLDHKPSVKNKSYRIRDHLALNNLPMVA